jgi:hypothetical protein
MSDIISSGMIFSTHSKHNLLHEKGKKTSFPGFANMPMKGDLRLLIQKLSFSLLPSSIKSDICLSAQKYVKVVNFIMRNGMQW